MSAFVAELRALIGAPPAGYDFIEYIIAAVLLVFLIDAAISLVAAVFKWIGGQ